MVENYEPVKSHHVIKNKETNLRLPLCLFISDGKNEDCESDRIGTVGRIFWEYRDRGRGKMVRITMGKKGWYVKASGARQVCLLCPLDPGSGSHFFADAMNRGQSFALFSLITNSFFFVAKFRVCGIEIALGDWVQASSLQFSSCFSLLELFLGGFWQRFLFY